MSCFIPSLHARPAISASLRYRPIVALPYLLAPTVTAVTLALPEGQWPHRHTPGELRSLYLLFKVFLQSLIFRPPRRATPSSSIKTDPRLVRSPRHGEY